GTFTPLGAGCWAALAPDDSRRMWFLDNDHRNLTFIEGATGRSWQIDLSRAPGVDGYEIYHPRWSNQLPFLTMTGPYTEGRFWNRVRGGGAGVELYVGRFSANLSDVDEWVRVTDNARADFYPDLWLDLGTQPGVATDAP
ncbi:MAG: hypothetical protein HY701_04420, partial [Gemmatimonadetes bacterium]|nr:hypothetical protein [Gemmatimonadota bacterium]